MTDHKSWLWRRRPSEKNKAMAEKQDLPSKASGEEMHIPLAEKAERERDLKDLSDKLSFALSECNANGELAKKHAKAAQDALAGWEKAETKALSMKQELDEALQQKAACKEQIIQLEAALKECMQQLRFVREEKEQRIHDVLAKMANGYDKKRLIFEENLSESSKKIAGLQSEITQLRELIKELNQEKARAKADVKELSKMLDSAEKQNASLKYEVRVLEKELDIRNKERDLTRQAADATHKQHVDNVQKIAKLESECQRLRVLVRKRLPGPAAVAKMKSEVRMLERGPTDTRRRTNTNLVVEKLRALEEENVVLRQTLEKKTNELNVYARASLSLTQAKDINGVSSDINLMDDFVEMEKMALVCLDKPVGSSPVDETESDLGLVPIDSAGKQIVPVSGCQSGLSRSISKFDWDEKRNEGELETPCSSLGFLNGHQGAIPLLQIQCDLKEEIGRLKDQIRELESAKKEVEERYDAMVDDSKSLSVQLENRKLEDEDLNAQLSATKTELGDAFQKVLSLEAEAEYRTKHSEELEAGCLQLETQIDNFSATIQDADEAVQSNEDEKQLQTDWDITAASEKLAQCQETIFNLGKQLKAMASPRDMALLDKVISSPTKTPKEKGANKRSSLLDKMLAEDDEEFPKTKEVICTSEQLKPPPGFLKGTTNPTFESDSMNQSFRDAGFGHLGIVPRKKKQNGGLFRKLLRMKRKR